MKGTSNAFVILLWFHIIGLPADHIARARRRGQNCATRCGRGGRLHLVGQHLKGQRQQGIAGQDRERFVEGLVTGGPATPQVVVVHRRQIVVDQRIGRGPFPPRRPPAWPPRSSHRRIPLPAGRGSDGAACPGPTGYTAWRRGDAAGNRRSDSSERPTPHRSADRAIERFRRTKGLEYWTSRAVGGRFYHEIDQLTFHPEPAWSPNRGRTSPPWAPGTNGKR